MVKLIVVVLIALGAIPAVASAASFPRSEYGEDFPYFSTPSGRIACEYRRYRTSPSGYRVTCTMYRGSIDGQETCMCAREGVLALI